VTKVPTIFSAKRRAAARARGGIGADKADWLANAMVEDTADRLAFMQLAAKRALIIGPCADQLALPANCEVECCAHRDEETPISDGPFDLIISMGQLDTVNDLPGALLHLRNALNEGGVFIGQMLGAGTLPQLREIMMAADGERPSARLHPQIDNRAATGLLQRAGFSKQVVDQYPLSVSYADLSKLIADLREQGLTNQLADAPPPLTRTSWQSALDVFDDKRAEGDRVTERFEILTLTGWR